MTYIKKNTPSGPNALSADYYIFKFKEIYGDKYKYFPEDFEKREIGIRNRDLKIRLQCDHGITAVSVRRHLEGYECRYCKGTMIDKTIKNPTIKKARKRPDGNWNVKGTYESFIKKSKEIHGNRYDYSKFEYVNCKTKGIIICPIHGDFMQTPDSHINKQCGCPRCGSGGTYSEWYFKDEQTRHEPGVLYLVELSSETECFLKIGITIKNANIRYASPSKNGGYKCRIILQRDMSIYEAWLIEQKILKEFENDKYNPQIYFPGYTECISKQNEAMVIRGML